MKGLNSIGEGLTTGLLYASFGAMSAPVVVYGSPLLIKSGAFSLSGGFNTGAVLTRVGIEAGSQTIVNIASKGLGGWRDLDVADVVIAGSGLNFISGAVLGASIDITPFAINKFSTLDKGKDGATVVTDLTVGLISGGQSRLLDKSNINRTLIKVFDLSNNIKATGLGEVINENIKH